MNTVKKASILLLLLASALLIYYFPQMGLMWRLCWTLSLLFPLSFTLTSLYKLHANLDEKEAQLTALQKELEQVQTLQKTSQIVVKELQKARFEKESENRALTASLKEMYEKAQTFEAALILLRQELETSQAEKRNTPETEPLPQTDAQLKQQLEDRTKDLIAARKQLFQLEGELVVLQKINTEDASTEYFFAQIHELEEERKQLEIEVIQLEELISILMPKKRAPRSKKKKPEELVQLLF